jgi:hypothetical protein
LKERKISNADDQAIKLEQDVFVKAKSKLDYAAYINRYLGGSNNFINESEKYEFYKKVLFEYVIFCFVLLR